MINVGVLGATGYAGGELVRILANHEDVNLVFLSGHSKAGVSYSELYPNLRGIVDMKCIDLNLDDGDALEGVDVVFCALPHGLTQPTVVKAMKSNTVVIDLSADFRIHDAKEYTKWYDTPHNALDELKEAVYGLPEVRREKIANAKLIANPGCYPTSIILALYPLLKEGVISTNGIIADSKSGVSGAGRSAYDGNLYAQANENINAYKVGTHRHIPEIEQELSEAASSEVRIQFTPHLTPMIRGILSTIYVENKDGLSPKQIAEIYERYYKDEKFIRVLEYGKLPLTKAVSGSNFIDIGFHVDERTGRIILVSAIDNLIKGAAGQAVQNMNIIFGLEETKGLKTLPLWP